MRKQIIDALDLGSTKFSSKRPLTSYFKIQRLIASCVRGRRGLVNWSSIQNKQFLDIGCGPNTHQGLINLDYGWYPGVDLCWDVTKGIPLRSGSLDGIFTEHCLEHIPVSCISPILGECLRVLRSGGVIRIVVPDGELYMQRYSELLENGKARSLPYSHRDRINGLYSPIMSVNRIFREEGHQFIYDYHSLSMFLWYSGFREIQKLSFGNGRRCELLIDTPSRAIESLYVEAVKP
jgi:predicted SAM-dependent methyltransferase